MADLNSCIAFLQRLIRTPGLPGEEAATARLVHQEMEQLGYDDVYTDITGNVIGFIKGQGQAPAIMFNTHLDHVDVGDHTAWPFPPFEGTIHNECVWGRGAVDIKGPLSAQVYGVARILAHDTPPAGDIYVSAVVYEERGGLGARYLKHSIDTPLIVIGEPSSNQLYRGHRGRNELLVHVKGRSAHASAPNRGANPLYVMAAFLNRLQTLAMRVDPDLGPSTVAPTLLRTDQRSTNVIPGEAWLTLDWRSIPEESEENILNTLQPILNDCLLDGTSGTITVPHFPMTTYTGLTMEIPAGMAPFITRENDPALQAAKGILESLWGHPIQTGLWKFATDGGNFNGPGITCIGLGPGEESLAHTVNEHIPIEQINIALTANEALALHWPATVRHGVDQ